MFEAVALLGIAALAVFVSAVLDWSWAPQAGDLYLLENTAIGLTSTQLLLNGQGTSGPVVPVHWRFRFKNLVITNTGPTFAYVTLQGVSTVAGVTTPITLMVPIGLASGATINLTEADFEIDVPANYAIAAIVSVGSAAISGWGFFVKGY